MLAYNILSSCSSNKDLIDPLLEYGIVHSAIHQLRGLQIFMSFNKVSELGSFICSTSVKFHLLHISYTELLY